MAARDLPIARLAGGAVRSVAFPLILVDDPLAEKTREERALSRGGRGRRAVRWDVQNQCRWQTAAMWNCVRYAAGVLYRLLKVRLSEAWNALIMPWRIQDREVEIERLADPVAEGRMICEIVIGQRMDKRAQTGRFNHRNDIIARMFEEVDFILRHRVRADTQIHHPSDEQDIRSGSRRGATDEPIA